MLATLVEAQAQRWSRTDELLAINAEVTHALFRATLAAWGNKNTQIPEPLRITRPGETPAESGPPVVSFKQLARRMASGK